MPSYPERKNLYYFSANKMSIAKRISVYCLSTSPSKIRRSMTHEEFQIATILKIVFTLLLTYFKISLSFHDKRTLNWDNVTKNVLEMVWTRDLTPSNITFLHRMYMKFSNCETADHWLFENWYKKIKFFSWCASPSVHFAWSLCGKMLNF